MFLFANWPPPNYELPRTVMDDVTLYSGMFNSLKGSLGSIANVGLLLLSFCLSVCLIWSIFSNTVLKSLNLLRSVRYRELSRNVSSLDRERNMDSIVEDRVANMEVQVKAGNLFRQRNPDADLNERIYQRQLSYDALQAWRSLNPDADVNEAIYRRRVSYEASRQFGRLSPQSYNSRSAVAIGGQNVRSLTPGAPDVAARNSASVTQVRDPGRSSGASVNRRQDLNEASAVKRQSHPQPHNSRSAVVIGGQNVRSLTPGASDVAARNSAATAQVRDLTPGAGSHNLRSAGESVAQVNRSRVTKSIFKKLTQRGSR